MWADRAYSRKAAPFFKRTDEDFQRFPETADEIVERIINSDCILVSWHTNITAEILQTVPSLKYVGMCCSLCDEKPANDDIAEARKLGIAVQDVRDYGDECPVNGALDSNGNVYKFMQWAGDGSPDTFRSSKQKIDC